MRILIIEEALRENIGHWPAYIGTLARGWRAAGDVVDIVGHTGCGKHLIASLRVEPVLSANCWSESIYQGPIGGLRHSHLYRREIERWLGRTEPYDWILVLTTRLQHLLAWTRIMTLGNGLPRGRLLLLFVQGFGRYDGVKERVYFPATMANMIARSCFRALGASVGTGRVFLASETQAMRAELQAFSKLPVALFPHPVHPVDFPRAETHGGADHIVVSCPGLARYEKGSALLRSAINGALEVPALASIRFVLQWKGAFALPDGRMEGAPRDWRDNPRVTVVREDLAAEAFARFLSASDLVLLPYRREAYHNRLSRIAIEAAIMGRPVLYTRGTAIAELMAAGGVGVPIAAETPEAIIESLVRVVGELESLRAAAQAASAKVRQVHSAETFRRCLAQLAESGTRAL